MILTNDLIDDGMSSNGGWSEKQLKLLGIEWPPTKGWKQRVIGKNFDSETLDQFLSLRDKHLPEDN